MFKKLTMSLAGLAMLGSVASAEARELRLATAAPQKTPWGAWMDSVAANIEKMSGGKLKLNVFYSSQLGDEQSVIRQVVRGRIDITGASNTATSLVVPEFALMAAPYLWNNPQHSDCAFDNHVENIFGDMFENSGLVLLGWVEVGQMILFNRKKVMAPADLKNEKIRAAPTKASMNFFKAVGANAVPLGTLDALPSLKTGNVDGATWPTVYGIAVGTHKMAPNVTLTNHSHQIGTFVMSAKIWKKLSKDEQMWLKKGFSTADDLRKRIRGAEKALVGKIEKAGVPVHRPNATEMAQWRAAGEQAQVQLVKDLGGRAGEIWPKVQAAKKACAK